MHAHKINTHILFLPCQLQRLGDLGCACGPCSQKDDRKLVRKYHIAGFVNFASFCPCLWWSYVIYMLSLLILACPWGWFTQIMLMWANSELFLPHCSTGLRLDWYFIVQLHFLSRALIMYGSRKDTHGNYCNDPACTKMEPGHFWCQSHWAIRSCL